MSKLKMDKDNNKFAVSMQSKDGEVVPFPELLDLSGQVESWLNRLLDAQCNTIQVIIHKTKKYKKYIQKQYSC